MGLRAQRPEQGQSAGVGDVGRGRAHNLGEHVRAHAYLYSGQAGAVAVLGCFQLGGCAGSAVSGSAVSRGGCSLTLQPPLPAPPMSGEQARPGKNSPAQPFLHPQGQEEGRLQLQAERQLGPNAAGDIV